VSAEAFGKLDFQDAFARAWEIEYGTRELGLNPALHAQRYASRKAYQEALDVRQRLSGQRSGSPPRGASPVLWEGRESNRKPAGRDRSIPPVEGAGEEACQGRPREASGAPPDQG
jgi:hypothetical protein